MRPHVVLASLLLSLAALAQAPSPAAASCNTTGSPHTRVDSVSVETRDGTAWKSGDPVSVVIRMSRIDDDWSFPDEGLAVVMRTDAERTKCLDVPLRKIGGTADQAIYAGVFYPFRVAEYSAKLTVGGEAHDILFTVGTPAISTDPTNVIAEIGYAGAASDAITAPRDPLVPVPVVPAPLAATALAGAAALALVTITLTLTRRRVRSAA